MGNAGGSLRFGAEDDEEEEEETGEEGGFPQVDIPDVEEAAARNAGVLVNGCYVKGQMVSTLILDIESWWWLDGLDDRGGLVELTPGAPICTAYPVEMYIGR